jgi:dipeptidyl aminopeptidase/acylaminoacyl peptidase
MNDVHAHGGRLILIAFGCLAQCIAWGQPLRVAEAVIFAAQVPGTLGTAQFDLSPDGTSVVYTTAKPTTDGAAYEIALWISGTQAGSVAHRLDRLADSPSPYATAAPRFSSDGNSIVYLGDADGEPEFKRVDLQRSAADAPLRAKAVKLDPPLASESRPIRFEWSPGKESIAFIVTSPPEPEPAGGIETSVEWPNSVEGPPNRLALLDLRSGRTRMLTKPDLDVTGLTWSPDGRRIAISASPVESVDIYLVDVESGETKVAARLLGVDSSPSWSPNGRWIAFATQAGHGSKDWLQSLGVIDVHSGDISYPAARDFAAGLGSPRDFAWSADSALLLTAFHHLQSVLFELSLPQGKLRKFSTDESTYITGVAVARKARRVAFMREALAKPGDLWLTKAHTYAPQRLTHLNPALELPSINSRVVSWRSIDGKWDLRGVLLTPLQASAPMPLVTLIEGGPQMVHFGFDLGLQYPVHALVASGYAVFVPNTRGRSGYSHEFRRAIRDEKDYVGGGFSDLMSGIDNLVRGGIADPARLGLAGFSYGAYLTAHAITRTNRFRAASINDVALDLVSYSLRFAANPVARAMWDDMMGFSDPYDPEAVARMRAQSPLYHAARIKTPALLEAGQTAYGGMEDGVLPLFQSLKRLDVPTEFIRYPRTGHGIAEPRLRLESAQRNLEWFDYWLRGKATPRMKELHGAPRL